LWKVLYEPAVRAWLSLHEPDQWTIERVLEWLERLKEFGPPDDCIPLADEDLYLSPIPRTELIASYYVLAYERLLIIKLIDL
jgi:hypothetical protein